MDVTAFSSPPVLPTFFLGGASGGGGPGGDGQTYLKTSGNI